MDKQIEEMAEIMYQVEAFELETLAEALYNAGYRKLDDHAILVLRKAKGLEEKVRKETADKFAKMVSQAIVDNTYPYFDKDGKPVNIWKAVLGYDKIDEIVKEITEGENE